jgi:DNA polymerase III subunit epsilon
MGALRSLPVIVLDCQATGASPQHGHLLEIGWMITRAELEPDAAAASSSLIALPDGAAIPTIVGELTGVRIEELAGAPSAAEIWARIRDELAAIADAHGVTTAVIHFARFEQSFLHELHARIHPGEAFPLRLVCTHEIARRLLPGMPRRGLRALAGYCGHATEELRRSAGHVWATALVWRHLAERLESAGVDDIDALLAWLAAPAPKPGKRVYAMPREKRLGLPDAPGVYRMLRVGGDVLYVGKATSLRDRVNSYFRKQTKVPDRLLELLSQARDLEVTPTASVLEAALLETDEIKRCDPPFNQALRERGRAPWFASAGLLALAPIADDVHGIGPLGSPWAARRFAALREVLGGTLEGEPLRRALLSALGRPGLLARAGQGRAGMIEIDDAVLTAGLDAFVCALPQPTLDVHAALQLGATLWREQLAAGAVPEQLEAEPLTDEPVRWSATDVHEHLDEAVLMIAFALRRARWLRALAESSVAFVDGAASRCLVIEQGRVIARDDHDPGLPPPLPPGWTRSDHDRAAAFDLPMFDRLRVLTTELRRIAESGGAVMVRLGPRRLLRDDRLRRVLAWV